VTNVSGDVLVLAECSGDEIQDSTYELLGKARELAHGWGGKAVALLLGDPGTAALADQLRAADAVVSVEHPALAGYLPEAYETALLHVLRERSPRLLLLPNDTVGLDLGAALSVCWDAPLAAYVAGLTADDGELVATCQILGGKVIAEVALSAARAICTVIGGSFDASAGRTGGAGELVRVAPPAELDAVRMSLQRVIEPEAGDVDITSAELLVSVGRGIGSKDDLELVQELADALDAPLSASRPITDSGWLPKTRQVGKSGLKVKPRAYLAFGISGAPEHLEGMRGAELIVACNTDPKAPLFDVAHYGTTEDLFDLVPALTDRLGG
jgi:electron transfer flavoprotein alpha subunit